jgi:prepilin-type N-terminal cleavage/methylation domain-containing protein
MYRTRVLTRHRNGFTILEVLIALVAFVTGVVMIAWAISAGIFASTDIEGTDLALNIARANMEIIKDTAYAGLADSGPAADPNFSDFDVTVDVAEGQNPMQVDVTVTRDVKGGQTSLVLTTLVADY